jgi:hypothetical protein
MSLSGSTIIGHGKNRNENDFYPTPSEVTFAFLENISWPTNITVWEPACGQNHMVDVLKTKFTNVIGTDIQTGNDFLTSQMLEADACVTNPPFSLSVEFIKKATEYPYAAMLLKSTYWHSAKRTKLFYDRRPSKILCLNWRPQFDQRRAEKSSPTMDFIWTVWEPETTTTEFIVCPKPTKFFALGEKKDGN